MDDSVEWWVGSEPEDIERYLRAHAGSDGGYPLSAFRWIRCDCGSVRFRLERAGEVTSRECAACGSQSFTCRVAEDWEEAVEEEGTEAYSCVGCGGDQANVGVGLAAYDEAPDLDAVKWFYVGVRCADCGTLGCFNDGKVGRGPVAEVSQEA